MTTNVNEIQTRTSPHGYYATHVPCEGRADAHSPVLSSQYHETARDAYDDALHRLRFGAHDCPARQS